MKIRQATDADFAALTELKKPKDDEHRHMFEKTQMLRMLKVNRGESIYLIGEKGNKIIAHLHLVFAGNQTEPDYPNIGDLYVQEEERDKGVGTKMIEAAEKLVKEKGYSKISLAVNPTLNSKAKAFYERLGYKQTDTKPYLDGVYNGDEDWVVDMVKDLS